MDEGNPDDAVKNAVQTKGPDMFTITLQSIKNFFGVKTFTMTPNQTAGLASVSDHFVGIGNILAEGNISAEYGALAMQKLYEAKLAVDGAVSYGWNGGKPTSY